MRDTARFMENANISTPSSVSISSDPGLKTASTSSAAPENRPLGSVVTVLQGQVLNTHEPVCPFFSWFSVLMLLLFFLDLYRICLAVMIDRLAMSCTRLARLTPYSRFVFSCLLDSLHALEIF